MRGLLNAAFFGFVVPAAVLRRAMGKSFGWRKGRIRTGWTTIDVRSSDKSLYEKPW
jgi:hypothetical protein